MDFSNDEDYREYGELVALSKFKEARESLQACLARADESTSKAFLLASIGFVFGTYERDFDNATRLYTEAIQVDPSPSSLMAFARFRANIQSDYEAAVILCCDAIAIAPEHAEVDSQFDLDEFVEDARVLLTEWKAK